MAWKGLTCTAAAAVLVCGFAVKAADIQQSLVAQNSADSSVLPPLTLDDTTTAPAVTPASAPASAPAAAVAPPTPVMYLLGPTSLGTWLGKNNINITGFFEGGYFYDTANPRIGTGAHGDSPTLISFPGPYSNRGLLDQADLTLSKSIDSTKSWDWGFTFENGYGVDDSFIHSSGLLDNRPPNDPENQYDIIQANASLLLPLGSGLTLEAGKMLTFLSNEVINPTGNAFYTHSYNFFWGVPATNTGFTATYTFAKAIMGNDLTVSAGMSRGWNQTFRDNNGEPDFIAQAKTSLTSTISLVTNYEIGPEATKDNKDYWTTLEAIVGYTASDQLTLTGDFLYNDAPHDAATTVGDSEQWYGACGYAGYKINSYFTLNGRLEWFRDQGGATTGIQANYQEATVGVQIHPLPNDNIFQFLQLRPEIREDWADRRAYDASGDGGRGEYSELTLAMDAIMQF